MTSGRRATKGLVAKEVTDYRSFADNREAIESILKSAATALETHAQSRSGAPLPAVGRSLQRAFSALSEAGRSPIASPTKSIAGIAAALCAHALERCPAMPTERDPADCLAAGVAARLAFWLVARLISAAGGVCEQGAREFQRFAGFTMEEEAE